MVPKIEMHFSPWILLSRTSQVAENTPRVQIYMLRFGARFAASRAEDSGLCRRRGRPQAAVLGAWWRRSGLPAAPRCAVLCSGVGCVYNDYEICW